MDQNVNPAFQFPVDGHATTVGIGAKKSKGKGKEILIDTSAPVEQNETPQNQRNKRLREGAMAAITGDREAEDSPSERVGRVQERRKDHRRRSSISRGKRISSGFETTGIIGGFTLLLV
jgi:kinetochore protein Mis13/DSN1